MSDVASAVVALLAAVRAELGSTSSPTTDPLVSCTDAGVPRKTWIAACRSGALRAVRIGRELRARRSDVDRWIGTLPSAARREPDEHAHEGDELDRALARGRVRLLKGGR